MAFMDGSILLNYVDDYLDCGSDASLEPTDAVSIVARVCMPSFVLGQRTVAKGVEGYELDVYPDNLRFVLNNSVHGE